MSLKDRLKKSKVKEIDVEGYGKFHVKVMSGTERQGYAELFAAEADKAPMTIYKYVIAHTLCDADGNRVYGDGEESEIAALDSLLIDGLFTAGHEVNFPKIEDVKKN